MAISKRVQFGMLPAVLIIVACCLLVYGQTVQFGLVWDDKLHLIGNPSLRPITLRHLVDIWRRPYEGLYIPVAYTFWGVLSLCSNWLTGTLFNPAIFHGANVVVHTVNCVLVLLLLRRITGDMRASLLGSLLFALHPLQVETVAWISGMRGLLATAFGFGALLAHLDDCDAHYAGRPAGKARLTGFVLLVLALLSKPSAIIIPLFAWVLEMAIYRPRLPESLRRIVPWLIPALVILAITKAAQDVLPGTMSLHIPYWARPLTWGDAFFFYLTKLIYPFGLSACQSRTIPYLAESGVWYWTSSVSVMVLAAAIALRWRMRFVLVSMVLFVVGFLPVSGLVVFNFESWSTVASRYVYMSMLGAGLLFGQSGRNGVRQLSLAIAVIFLVFWSLVTGLMQVPVWRNEFSVWNEALAVSPVNANALQNRALAYAGYGRWELMLNDLNHAINLERGKPVGNPDHPDLRAAMDNLNWRIASDTRLRSGRLPLDFLTRAYLDLKLGNLNAAVTDLDRWQQRANPYILQRISKIAAGLRKLPEAERRHRLLKMARKTWGKDFPALFSTTAPMPH